MVHKNKGFPLAALLAFAGATPFVASAPALAADSPGAITETEYGPMLVSRTGMSLYFTSGDDMAKGTSACTSEQGPTTQRDPTAGLGQYNMVGYKFVKSCLDMWKPYEAPADATARGDWSVFTRPEGLKQWAWQGKPVYFSVRDQAPGDKNGVNPDAGGAGPSLGRVGGGQRGGGGPQFRFAGYAPFPSLPMGMRIIRYGNALVIADANAKALYTPRAGARTQRACAGCEELKPVEAAWVANLNGEWSVVSAGVGRQQYAWKGQPLFAASEEMTEEDIARAGYELVVYRKLPAPPPEIGIHMSLLGEVYTDKAGRTLYTFACQTQGCDLPGAGAAAMSALCSTGQECMRRWRPYLAGPNARPSAGWTVVDVPQPMFTDPAGQLYPAGGPTVKGWAYRGKPVFTFYEDKEPGDTWGITVRWFNASPTFSAVRVPGVPGPGGRF